MTENSLINVMKESAINFADHSINLATDQDVLQELPVVKYLVSLYKIGEIYKQQKVYKNAMAFLNAIKHSEFVLPVENKDYDEFVDTMSLILMESEKPIKAKIAGNLTKSFAEQLINFDTFNHLCLLVFTASVPVLKVLASCATPEFLEDIENAKEKHGGIQPEVYLKLRRTNGSSTLLKSMGVLVEETVLNGYGIALILYGKMYEIDAIEDDRFSDHLQ